MFSCTCGIGTSLDSLIPLAGSLALYKSLKHGSNMKFMPLQELKDKIGLSKSAIYKKIKDSEFPVSVPIGSRTVAWLESDINEWVEWRVQVRARASKGFFN